MQASDPTTDEPVAGTSPPESEPLTPSEVQAQQALDQQGQIEPQVIPEQRPQAFVSPTGGISDASVRLDNAEPMPPEAFDRANSDEAKKEAASQSRMPRLLEGQRVTFIDGPEKGRMGFVSQVVFTDAIQQMLAATGVPEARFADVAQYIVRTRDGRSDIIAATPDQIKPLDDTEGWGRGQI